MIDITEFNYTPISSHLQGNEYVIDNDVIVSMTFHTNDGDDDGDNRIVTATAHAGSVIPKLAIPPVGRILTKRWDNDYITALSIMQICIYTYAGNGVITRAACDEIVSILLRRHIKNSIKKFFAFFMMDLCAGWYLPWGELNNIERMDSLSLKITYSWDDITEFPDLDDEDDDDAVSINNQIWNTVNTSS